MIGRVIVTCGPSYEPIDEVRRITNFSTGQLGASLSNRLATDGHEVICLRGSAALRSVTLDPRVRHTPFTTNDDLLEKLNRVPDRDHIVAVFHAAALADFRVDRPSTDRKISSRAGSLTLTLVPALKLIGKLRTLFPKAWIVGWKYELDGSREEVMEKGRRQLSENSTDACVLNGAAYGDGFGFITSHSSHWSHLAREGELIHLPGKSALCDFLAEQLHSAAGGAN